MAYAAIIPNNRSAVRAGPCPDGAGQHEPRGCPPHGTPGRIWLKALCDARANALLAQRTAGSGTLVVRIQNTEDLAALGPRRTRSWISLWDGWNTSAARGGPGRRLTCRRPGFRENLLQIMSVLPPNSMKITPPAHEASEHDEQPPGCWSIRSSCS